MLSALAYQPESSLLAAINLHGDIILRKDGSNEIHHGHTGLLDNITCIGNIIVYSSDNRLFSFDASVHKQIPMPV